MINKTTNLIFCLTLQLGIDSLQGEQLYKFPPISSIHKEISRDACGKNDKMDLVERPVIPFSFDTYNRIDRDTTYTFDYLNTLNYDELIDLIITLDWWEIDGLFEYSDDSYEFYSDTLRMQALFDAVEERGNIYTVDTELGIGVLVELIRSGFYLAFYYDDLNFLRDFDFMDNTIPGMDAISNNPNFGLGTDVQTSVVKAFGAYQGIGMSSIHSLTKSAGVIEDFFLNFESYIDNWDKSNAMYWLGDGVYYSLYTYSYHFNPEDTEFYNEVDSLFTAIANIGLYGTVTEQNEWLLNNAVWWNARIGLFDDEAIVVQFLTDVVQLYGEWTGPSLEAIEMLCWLYNCEYADGTPIDEGEIWQSVHDWLLPNRITYDDETIIFKTGDGVTPEKIETLYWAMKEVRAQFHRVSLNDIPLEEGNPDDSLIAVIYNSPDDYTYNNFLYGLGTNNGGIYIESWGTFFTYERTPQESIYTLEDLFRHEFSHYLQGKYLVPGMWGDHPIYDNQRLTWFEEGGAEFLAGSSRLNGIQTRLTMVERIAQNESDRMTLAEVVNATYGNWEFYRYGFAFFDYMYKYRMDMLLEMVEFVQTGNGDSFDILMDEIANSDELNDHYQAHMDSLKTNQNNFTDPVTNSLYFEEIEIISTEDITNEISSISQIQNGTFEIYGSSDHNLLSIRGELVLGINNDSDSLWLAMNSNLNNILSSLDEINWNGYNTVNGWFSNPELNENNYWAYNVGFLCKLSNFFSTTTDQIFHVATTGSDETGDGSEESPFSTIQKAVNVASNGDTILVMNGLYIENIDWSTTNNIRLIGSHIDSTIIDGGNNGKVIDNSDETSHPIEISNLTIQNGISTGKGGGISLKMVGDLLLKNIRVNNNHAQIGGGIYIEGEGSESFIPTVVHFENAIISNNSAENYGGGVSLSGDVISSIIKNVTVVNNFATNGGGGIQSGSLGDYAIIVNSIFWNNQPTNVDGMVFPYYSNIDIPNGSNNIFTDPLFVNDSTNFNLLDGSPCIDGGTEFLVVDLSTYMLPGTVPDTIININDEDYYGLAPDMGAIEYQSILHLDRDLLPKQYILHQNYPNPFNPVTSLRYDLPKDGLVNITIYDMMGRIVKTLVNSSQTAGYKSIKWNATNDIGQPVSAGMYIYTIQAGEFRQTKKMVLLK